MISRSILTLLSHSSRAVVQPLQGIGRWTIQYEPSIVTMKVNWANEDHCGVCETAVIPDTARVEHDITTMLGCCCEIPSAGV